MTTHVSPQTFADYLDGMLDAPGAERLERHVSNCSECAAMLQRQARLEEYLYEAAAHPRAGTIVAHARKATARASGSTLSAAAAVLLMVFSFAPPHLPRALDNAKATEHATQVAVRGDDDASLSCLPTSPLSGSMCSDVTEDAATLEEPADVTVADVGVLCGADEFGQQSLCVPGMSSASITG